MEFSGFLLAFISSKRARNNKYKLARNVTHSKYWGKGVGSEAVSAVVLDYAPELSKRGYKIKEQPFEAIVATARKDNPGSWKILEKVGMKCEGEQEKFGATRKCYRKKIG